MFWLPTCMRMTRPMREQETMMPMLMGDRPGPPSISRLATPLYLPWYFSWGRVDSQ